MGFLDGQHLNEWVERYTDRLVRLAYTYERCWQTAEDRVQDAFVKAYRQQHQLRNQAEAFPWLARIVINECKMSWRRSFREVLMEWLPDTRQLASAEVEAIGKLESERMYQRVLDLPEPFRTTIVLYYFEELSLEEISLVLQVSRGTVKSRLARGRDRLQKLVGKEEGYGRTVEKCKTTL